MNVTGLLETLQCESDLDPNAVGDHGESFGLSQIHLKDHPEVSRENALDPIFAVNFAAAAFKEGRQHEWTCARSLGL